MVVFGERLKALRLKKHLKQDELGEIFGIAPSTIGTYERGTREPSLETLLEMSKFFNVSLDYLLGVSEDERTLEDFQEDNPRELKEFLNQNHITFNGAELSEEEKRRMTDILTGLFWEHFSKKK